MKKIIALSLATMLALSGCANEAKPSDPTTAATKPTESSSIPPETTPPAPPEPELVKAAQVQVLSCCFRESILPLDFEVYEGCFPPEDGKVYVELTLLVENTGEAPLGAEDIRASFDYGEDCYNMQFEVEESIGNFANVDKFIHPGMTERVHLFYTVDAAALDTDMTVRYTVLGEEQELPVTALEAPTLESKQAMTIGQSVSREGAYSVQVLDCLISETLHATGSGATKYYVNGSEVFVLILKVSCQSESELTQLEGYLMTGQEAEFAQIYLESSDHLELTALEEGCAVPAGQEQILHLALPVPVGTPSEGMAMRFNILRDCFYCYAVG